MRNIVDMGVVVTTFQATGPAYSYYDSADSFEATDKGELAVRHGSTTIAIYASGSWGCAAFSATSGRPSEYR